MTVSHYDVNMNMNIKILGFGYIIVCSPFGVHPTTANSSKFSAEGIGVVCTTVLYHYAATILLHNFVVGLKGAGKCKAEGFPEIREVISHRVEGVIF